MDVLYYYAFANFLLKDRTKNMTSVDREIFFFMAKTIKSTNKSVMDVKDFYALRLQ